jgi:hypothetical protein
MSAFNYSKWDNIDTDSDNDTNERPNNNTTNRSDKKKDPTGRSSNIKQPISDDSSKTEFPSSQSALAVLQACEVQRTELNHEFYKVADTQATNTTQRYEELLTGYDQIIERITSVDRDIAKDIISQVAVTVVSCWLNGTCCLLKLGKWEDVITRCEEVLAQDTKRYIGDSISFLQALNEEQTMRVQYFLCYASMQSLATLSNRRLSQLEEYMNKMKAKVASQAQANAVHRESEGEYDAFLVGAEKELTEFKNRTIKSNNTSSSNKVDSAVSVTKAQKPSAELDSDQRFAQYVNKGKQLFDSGNKLDALRSFLSAADLVESRRLQYAFDPQVLRMIDYLDKCIKKCLEDTINTSLLTVRL